MGGVCKRSKPHPLLPAPPPGPATSLQLVCVLSSRLGLELPPPPTPSIRCPLVAIVPRHLLLLSVQSQSARKRRFWFWTEGLSCHREALVNHWRSWAFSWADSAQRRRAERAPCTWPLRGGRETKGEFHSSLLLKANSHSRYVHFAHFPLI